MSADSARCPNGTSRSANVLFFDRKPASETTWTKELWIYDFRTNKHFIEAEPARRADLDEFVEAYKPDSRTKREEGERFKSFTYEEPRATR